MIIQILVFRCVNAFESVWFQKRYRNCSSTVEMTCSVGIMVPGISQRHVAAVLSVQKGALSRMWAMEILNIDMVESELGLNYND